MFTPYQFGLGIVSAGLAGIVGTAALLEWRGAGQRNRKESVTAVAAEGRPDTRLASLEPNAPGLKIDDPGISFRNLHRLGERMALQNPEDAIKAGMKIPGKDNREAFIGTVFRTWGEKDGESAAVWATRNLQGEARSDALYYVVDGWAEADPKGAADWFTKNTDGVILEDAAWELLEAWGRKDPDAAFRWSENLDPYLKQSVMDGLAEGWAAVDPGAAKEAGMKMLAAGDAYAYDFLISVATQWGGSDPRAAAQWGESVLNEKMRDGVLSEVGEVWSQTDPQAAAAWAGSLTDPGSRRFGEGGIARGWSEHDPGAAMDWALGLEADGAQMKRIAADIMSNWADIDPKGTVQWLEAKQPGPQRDTALEAFSYAVLPDNAEAAIAWANQIADAPRRNSQLENLIAKWVQRDGQAAINAINRMDLPAELKPVATSPGN